MKTTSNEHLRERVEALRSQIAKVYLGESPAIDWLICCLLSRGHVLLEDVPGVGKTLLASTLAKSIDCPFARVQLTPDMLPADLLGVSIFSRDGGELTFQPGPIFTSVLLADEINRTTPRTQSALLEAMSDGRVSIDGTTHDLGEPFIVVATQNPAEFEGTYPLPENQLDRFLMRLSLGYPGTDAEIELLDLRPATTVLEHIEPVLSGDEIIQMQHQIDGVHLSEPVRRYIVEIAHKSREADEIMVGLSPRGSLALAQAARAWAWMHDRDFVEPDDVRALLVPVCAHRIMIEGAATGAHWLLAAELIEGIARSVNAPV
ncbi:MAG: ATPase [Phycisphaerae bacterium]|nr:ATPase [Phycisphaerae bacterium]MBM91553.1 ATPase [Phycisphaerae bacterium]